MHHFLKFKSYFHVSFLWLWFNIFPAHPSQWLDIFHQEPYEQLAADFTLQWYAFLAMQLIWYVAF